MFKKLKQERLEKKENTFKQPTIKKGVKVISHIREYTPVEKILFTLKTPSKAKTVFRKILTLPQKEIDKNIYMLANGMLNSLLENRIVDKLFYSVLGKLLSSKKANSISKLCIDYLKAQLTLDKSYKTYLEFLIRHSKDIIVVHKSEILSCISSNDLKDLVSNLKAKRSVPSLKFDESYVFIRN